MAIVKQAVVCFQVCLTFNLSICLFACLSLSPFTAAPSLTAYLSPPSTYPSPSVRLSPIVVQPPRRQGDQTRRPIVARKSAIAQQTTNDPKYNQERVLWRHHRQTSVIVDRWKASRLT